MEKYGIAARYDDISGLLYSECRIQTTATVVMRRRISVMCIHAVPVSSDSGGVVVAVLRSILNVRYKASFESDICFSKESVFLVLTSTCH